MNEGMNSKKIDKEKKSDSLTYRRGTGSRPSTGSTRRSHSTWPCTVCREIDVFRCMMILDTAPPPPPFSSSSSSSSFFLFLFHYFLVRNGTALALFLYFLMSSSPKYSCRYIDCTHPAEHELPNEQYWACAAPASASSSSSRIMAPMCTGGAEAGVWARLRRRARSAGRSRSACTPEIFCGSQIFQVPVPAGTRGACVRAATAAAGRMAGGARCMTAAAAMPAA